MKKTLIILLVCLLSVASGYAKQKDSSYFQMGVERWDDKDYEEALQFFERDLQQNPENGKAYAYVASIYLVNNNLEEAQKKYELALKYMKKKDSEARYICCMGMAGCMLASGDTIKSIETLTTAITLMPETADPYIYRANIYLMCERYDEALADFSKAESLEGDFIYDATIGTGKCLLLMERYDKAIEWLNKAIPLNENGSNKPYLYLAKCYYAKKQYKLMAENLVEAFDKWIDDDVIEYLNEVSRPTYSFLSARLQVKLNENPDSYKWLFICGLLNEDVAKYRKAIDYYHRASDIKDNSELRGMIAFCCEKEGDFAHALKEYEIAAKLDSTADMWYYLGAMNMNLFMYDEAISCLDKYVLAYPENEYGYGTRGMAKWYNGDVEGAAEDLTISAEFGMAYSYGVLGTLYQYSGDTIRAKEAFLKNIELDTIPDNGVVGISMLFLEGKEAAINWMKENKDKVGDEADYTYACIYSISGDLDSAAYYLERDLMRSRESYSHMQHDFDLENLRRSPLFNELLEKYKPVPVDGCGKDSLLYEEKSVSVSMTKTSGGVYSVDCKVNDLPLSFIFDTGAADVSLSSVEAAFMFKNKYLSATDVIGKAHFMTATGEVYPGTIINLKKVNIGGVEVNNVRASVVKNQSAPLLLGQSVLNRFGKVEIDYKAKSIKITRMKKKY